MTDSEATGTNEKKICPMISPRSGWEPWRWQDCREAKCAWWVEPGEVDRKSGLSGQCAVKSIADRIRAIQ